MLTRSLYTDFILEENVVTGLKIHFKFYYVYIISHIYINI